MNGVPKWNHLETMEKKGHFGVCLPCTTLAEEAIMYDSKVINLHKNLNVFFPIQAYWLSLESLD